ncbi:expressed unknown protein [Seminavis robusta]|uniref:SEA domain-containing protein n=1 Tax=Seminavis robusta TaxID=568900 RepID=A0A9N8DK16_9STRA|nr:expressed unknown protein [Seminavis robusta]|eukprot:Sro128_g061310.1 n/a (391) ;mRNA; f:79575-80747
MVSLSFPIIFLLSILPSVKALSSVPFGGVELQLQSSTSEKDPETLLVEVLTQTVKYLDTSFTDTLQNSDIEFSHIGLSVDSYDIDASSESNSVSFKFSGTAFFNSSPAPTQDDVLQILAQSFLGRNSQEFTSSLMQSKEPFLQRLSYAIVQVNGYVIPGGVDTESANPQQTEEPDQSFDLEMIAIIVGCATGAVLLILLCYCLCCVGVEPEDADAYDDSPSNGKPAIQQSQTSETQDDIEAVSEPPSSPQSIASQDSSVFTYNPTSKISFDASTLSTNTTDTNALDLALWQQRNTINSRYAPFGHDISAIEMLNENKKDLSLIEEGDETATPAKQMEYLSRDYLSRRDRRDRSRASRESGFSGASERSVNSDVIADLRNLSQQINQYRKR